MRYTSTSLQIAGRRADTPGVPWDERGFEVMATSARLGALAAHPLPMIEAAASLVRDAECRWSRFIGGSELSAVNAGRGRPVAVSPATVALVRTAVVAWQRTGGRFDPTVLRALRAAGYGDGGPCGDGDDDDGHAAPGSPVGIACGTTATGIHVPGCADVVVDADAGTVATPHPLDLGGIGKGRAADLAVELLLALGADAALADLGGDVRVGGTPPPGGWQVGIEDPFHQGSGHLVASLSLQDGAVATSSRLRRSWAGGHHLIDPACGRPSTSALVQVSVVASTCTWAEVFAKAALLAGPEHGASLLEEHGLAGVMVTEDGDVRPVGTDRFAVAA